MIKILFFIEGLSGGGAEKVLRNLVNNMDQKKFDITVQTINQESPEAYLVRGIRYRAVNQCKTGIGKKLFSYWFRLCAELKWAYPLFIKDDYDIEIAYLETVTTKIISQSTNKNAAKLAWVHCDLSKKEGIWEKRVKLARQYQKFDRIMCVSQGVRAGFEKVFGIGFPTEVIYNVIDEDEIRSKSEAAIAWDCDTDKLQLLAVGRLSKQKNFTHLIKTCSKLRNADYQFQLSILGEGPEREQLEYQIQELGLADVVKLKGFCTNPYPYIKKADVIVCSSLYEGISTVVQEALILGKPVVTTPCTGMKELLGESEYGLVAEDTDDGLYKCLTLLLDSETALAEFKVKAELRGSFFSKEKIERETEQLFERVLAQCHVLGG